MVMVIKFSFSLALNLMHLYSETIYPQAIAHKAKSYNFFMRKLGCLCMPVLVEYS